MNSKTIDFCTLKILFLIKIKFIKLFYLKVNYLPIINNDKL